jgi:hypothetical protein
MYDDKFMQGMRTFWDFSGDFEKCPIFEFRSSS